MCRRFYFLAWEPELWERLSFLGEEDLDIDRALKTTFQLVRCIIIDHPLIANAVAYSFCLYFLIDALTLPITTAQR